MFGVDPAQLGAILKATGALTEQLRRLNDNLEAGRTLLPAALERTTAPRPEGPA